MGVQDSHPVAIEVHHAFIVDADALDRAAVDLTALLGFDIATDDIVTIYYVLPLHVSPPFSAFPSLDLDLPDSQKLGLVSGVGALILHPLLQSFAGLGFGAGIRFGIDIEALLVSATAPDEKNVPLHQSVLSAGSVLLGPFLRTCIFTISLYFRQLYSQYIAFTKQQVLCILSRAHCPFRPPHHCPKRTTLPSRRKAVLVVARKRNQKIMIGDDIVIMIVDIKGDQVQVGIDAPRSIPVHRHEIWEEIQQAGQQPDDNKS